MKERELKKLRRVELLEILVAQSVEIERLQEEFASAKRELENRKILIEDAGTMAEAALKLNRIFEDADAAARQYLENVKQIAEKGENKCSIEESEVMEYLDDMQDGKEEIV